MEKQQSNPGIFSDKKKNQRMGIGALVLAAFGLIVFHFVKPAPAQADEIQPVSEQVQQGVNTALDELPPGTAKFEVTKKDGTHECDVYVTERMDQDGWDKLVSKAQKFGCEVKAFFTEGDSEDEPKQAEVSTIEAAPAS